MTQDTPKVTMGFPAWWVADAVVGLVERMREETGNPWWPLEPPVFVGEEVMMEREMNVQITVAHRHNVGPYETMQRLTHAEHLREELQRRAQHA